jgi:predicted RNA-binding protein YlqC (UPF0109 family)
MDNDGNIEALLLQIVTALVDEENEVRVTSVTTDSERVFQVAVAPGDVGKIIGKSGRTAQSLRILLSAIGAARKTHYELNIITNY